ncbi:hypothetical protein HanIR_Chr03g0132431 [Helianthus annuus]|nr:hypothetical protein HanIR_Chr03g0132431 [Helianthus annuus]
MTMVEFFGIILRNWVHYIRRTSCNILTCILWKNFQDFSGASLFSNQLLLGP